MWQEHCIHVSGDNQEIGRVTKIAHLHTRDVTVITHVVDNIEMAEPQCTSFAVLTYVMSLT